MPRLWDPSAMPAWELHWHLQRESVYIFKALCSTNQVSPAVRDIFKELEYPRKRGEQILKQIAQSFSGDHPGRRGYHSSGWIDLKYKRDCKPISTWPVVHAALYGPALAGTVPWTNWVPCWVLYGEGTPGPQHYFGLLLKRSWSPGHFWRYRHFSQKRK